MIFFCDFKESRKVHHDRNFASLQVTKVVPEVPDLTKKTQKIWKKIPFSHACTVINNNNILILLIYYINNNNIN